MMSSTKTAVPARHKRASNPMPVAKPHKPGSPPNLCVVASPDELGWIKAQGVGKAKIVHAALALLRDVQSGTVKLASPAPEYLTLKKPTTPTPKPS